MGGRQKGKDTEARRKSVVNCSVLNASVQILCSRTLALPNVLQPIFLNEVLVKLPTDPSGDEPIFHISHIDRVYTLRAESINER